jgi:hypothetical protein
MIVGLVLVNIHRHGSMGIAIDSVMVFVCPSLSPCELFHWTGLVRLACLQTLMRVVPHQCACMIANHCCVSQSTIVDIDDAWSCRSMQVV